jgi:benzoylformate decarboxylase
MQSVREALFDVMRHVGLTRIFGNIGSTEEKMFDNFPSDFEYILSLHESVAVAMADAYSQASGEPVHVNLHTAAGSGDAMGSITTAWYNRAPMIITAGQQTREMLLMEPYLTNKTPLVELAPWVKWAYEPARPEDVPGAFLRAYAMAIQSPPGPVYLSLPMDDMDKPCPNPPNVRSIHARISAGMDVLAPVVEALGSATNPVLIIGGAVDQCGGWYDAIRLAEKLRARVLAAPMEGRPGFPETHPLYLGLASPSAAPLREQLVGADLVVVIGAPVFRFYPYTGGPILTEGTRLIHLTDSAEEAARAPVGDSFLVDPGRACSTLADRVSQSDRPLPAPKTRKLPPSPHGVVTSDLVYYTLSILKPQDAILVEEVPSTQSLLREWLPTSEPRSFFSMFSGVLGYGLPAACGVCLAERNSGGTRKVIALEGDGSAQFTIQAFWNASQQNLPILFIVLRNHEYAVLQSYSDFFELQNVPGLKIPGVDIELLARGYGVPGETVADAASLCDAITRGLRHNGPYLLQVDILAVSPPLLGDSGPKTQRETLEAV